MIADFPFEGGMDGDVPRWKAAKPYNWSQIIKSGIRGCVAGDQGAFWREGSLALTSPAKRTALVSLAKMGRFIR